MNNQHIDSRTPEEREEDNKIKMTTTTTQPMEEWEKEFFEKFGANTIWVVPSRENVETILDIYSFISHQKALSYAQGRADMAGEMREVVEKNLLIKCDKSYPHFCEELGEYVGKLQEKPHNEQKPSHITQVIKRVGEKK